MKLNCHNCNEEVLHDKVTNSFTCKNSYCYSDDLWTRFWVHYFENEVTGYYFVINDTYEISSTINDLFIKGAVTLIFNIKTKVKILESNIFVPIDIQKLNVIELFEQFMRYSLYD